MYKRQAVVNADHPFVAHVKQLCFCLKVVLHVLVVIEMVLRQIGERSHFKVAVSQAALVERMGRHFYYNILTASLNHIREDFLEFSRVGGSLGGGNDLIDVYKRQSQAPGAPPPSTF